MATVNDVVVVGGGLVGLAAAHHLLRLCPNLKVSVLEANSSVGSEQSSRNSGVVHAGVYYPPGSRKAVLCVAGRQQLETFCHQHGLPYVINGKLIVALDARERDALVTLEQRARANTVPIERLGPSELASFEPRVRGIAALYSPSTAITDFGVVAETLAATLNARGVGLHTNTRVTALAQDASQVTITTTNGTFQARNVIVAAGLAADRLARMSGLTITERVVPFRGSWLTLAPHLNNIVTHNIYPVPVGNGLPFLGVHVTRRPDGGLWVGPNAVLMGARSGIRRFGVNRTDLFETLTYPGIWRLARTHLKTGVGELARDVSRTLMTRAVQQYLPEITRADLAEGPFGIRAQLLGRDGRLIDDFVLRTQGRIMHVLNAPSPAATASFAIGEELARGVILAL
ncbi:MAG: L-2-hydroxyglutarate oxidase [Nitriliruptoraceae bacterium]